MTSIRPARVTLDASVIIAHLSPWEPQHELAGRLLEAHAGSPFLAHHLTVGEVLVGPAKHRALDLARDALARLRVIEWIPGQGSGERVARLRAETGLKMPDVCVLDTAIENGTALATFDRALAEAATRLGIDALQEDVLQEAADTPSD